MTHPTHDPADDSGAQEGGPASAPYSYPPPPTASEPVGLTDTPTVASDRRPRRRFFLVGGLAAALVLGVGGAFAVQQLSGAGTQPAEVLPSDAYRYIRLDLDPAAGQKIAAVRFLSQLPEIKNLASGDPRQGLWELAMKQSDNQCLKKVNFDTEVAPWLGERAGAVTRPGGNDTAPNFALALQVTDEEKAKNGLAKVLACGDDKPGDVRMRDGYALITPAGKGDELVAAIDKGTLAANATFGADMAALGQPGVLSFWGDLQSMVKEALKISPKVGSQAGFDLDQAKGRYVGALRFEPDHVELAAIGRGFTPEAAKALTPGSSTELANLPADTMVAFHVANGDKGIDAAWPQLKKQIEELGAAEGQDDVLGLIEDEVGLRLPDDLKVLMGSSFTFAMPGGQNFDQDLPILGARIVSSDAARAEEVITQLEQLAGADVLVTKRQGDQLQLGTWSSYPDRLRKGGDLGKSPAFTSALGDLSTSGWALYLDLDQLEKYYLDSVDGDARTVLKAMRSAGMKVSTSAPGELAFTLRVVAN